MSLRPLSLAQAERVVWFTACVVLIFGYYFVTVRYERRVAASSIRTQDFYRRMIINQRLVANDSKVRALRVELRRRLSGVLVAAPLPDSMAALLRDVDTLARADRSTLLSVVPQRPVPAAGATINSPPSRTSSGLQNVVVEVTVRGRFSDVLRLIARMPTLHTLLRVSDVQFSLAGGQKGVEASPLLDAKIRTLVYRYSGAILNGEM